MRTPIAAFLVAVLALVGLAVFIQTQRSAQSESIRLASKRLLQPFGVVRVIRIYDQDTADKKDKPF